MNPEAVAVLIPIVIFGGFFSWLIARTVSKAYTAKLQAGSGASVGEALAERIRHRSPGRWAVAREDPQRVAALEEQVSHLQEQVGELAERLDFAERMLAERRERKLGAGQ